MKIKLNYIVIPLIAIATASLGGYLTSLGMDGWYAELVKPSWQPPSWVFSPVWTTIYILTTISALLVYNSKPKNKLWYWTLILFALNAVLNALWSYLFFTIHTLNIAIYEAGLLALSVAGIMILTWKQGKQHGQFQLYVVSLILLPYLLWVSFATYLTYTIALLN